MYEGQYEATRNAAEGVNMRLAKNIIMEFLNNPLINATASSVSSVL